MGMNVLPLFPNLLGIAKARAGSLGFGLETIELMSLDSIEGKFQFYRRNISILNNSDVSLNFI